MQRLLRSGRGPALPRTWRLVTARGLLRALAGDRRARLRLGAGGARRLCLPARLGPDRRRRLESAHRPEPGGAPGNALRRRDRPDLPHAHGRRRRARLRRHHHPRPRRPHRPFRARRPGRPRRAFAADVRDQSARLELDGLDLRLRLRPDGALSIAAAADSTAATIELPAPAASEVGAGRRGARFRPSRVPDHRRDDRSRASRSTASDSTRGHLEVENEALGKKTVYDDLRCRSTRTQDAATIRASARGSAGRWSVDATASGGEARKVSLTARDLSLDDVLLMHARRPPFETDMPISFKIEARVAANSAIQALQGRFSLGAGYFKLDDPDHEPFLVDEATGDVAWDAQAHRFRFNDLQLLVRIDARPRLGLARPADARRRPRGSAISNPATRSSPRRGRARSRSSSIRPRSTRAICRGVPLYSRSAVGPRAERERRGERRNRRGRGRGDAQAEFAGRPERRRRRSQAVAELRQRRRARLVPGAHSRRTRRRRLDERGLGRGRIRSGGPQARRPAPTACMANFRRAKRSSICCRAFRP